MESIINPTALIDKIVSDNSELLEKLNKDPEYTKWYDTLKNAERVNASLNQDYLSMMLQNEYLPGEQRESEFSYLDNRFQIPLGTRLLRNAGKTEGPRMIKNKRRLQFNEFAKPSVDAKVPGLTVKFINKDYVPGEIEKQNLKEFTFKFVDKFFFGPASTKANFGNFLGICYEDYFDLDDITFEIRRSMLGKPLGFHLCDPVLVYHVVPRNYTFDRWDKDNPYNLKSQSPKRVDNEYKYLLMKNNIRYAAFRDNMMLKSHFYTSSDYNNTYRGYSIMEQGIRMVMNIVNSISYNSSNFSNNRTPMGMLAIKGGQTNRPVLEQFKKLLYAYLSGANNRYRLPILGLPENGSAEFVNFASNSREMEFHLWMTLLMTVLCQLSGTNPEEISMSSHEAAMVGKKLFDAAPDGILQVSRDTGLNSFLRYMEVIINSTNVLKEMTGYNVECRFNGLEVEDERIKVEIRKSQLSSTRSYNDVILEQGGQPQTMLFGGENIYDVKGIDSPVIMQVLQAKEQAMQAQYQQQQQMQQQQEQALQGGASQGMTENDKKLVDKGGPPVTA